MREGGAGDTKHQGMSTTGFASPVRSSARVVPVGSSGAPPSNSGDDRENERHATWIEPFFDLVFVLAVGQLAGLLHGDPSPGGFLRFAALFVPVWWTWLGFAYFADQFDTDAATSRLTVLLAMLGALALSVNLGGAFDGDSRDFVAAHVALRLLLVALYAQAYRANVSARSLCARFGTGFILGAALWTSSLLVPEPGRYGVWAVALAVEIATPVAAYVTVRAAPAHVSHMPERLGLFTLIVLGEVIIAVGASVGETEWPTSATVVAVAGFALAACLWWLYFDRLDTAAFDRAMRGGRRALARSFVYGYGHLVVFASLAAASVGIELAIEEATHGTLSGRARAALCGGVATYLVALTVSRRFSTDSLRRRTLVGRLATAGLTAGLFLAGPVLAPPVLVGMLALTMIGLAILEVA